MIYTRRLKVCGYIFTFFIQFYLYKKLIFSLFAIFSAYIKFVICQNY